MTDSIECLWGDREKVNNIINVTEARPLLADQALEAFVIPRQCIGCKRNDLSPEREKMILLGPRHSGKPTRVANCLEKSSNLQHLTVEQLLTSGSSE